MGDELTSPTAGLIFDPNTGMYWDPNLHAYVAPPPVDPFMMHSPFGAVWMALAWIRWILGPLLIGFGIWMAVDCIKQRRSWFWLYLFFATGGLGAIIYWFVYHWEDSWFNRRFVNWTFGKRRIRELEAKIFSIDSAYHRVELGDIYLKREKWDDARRLYEEALQRDPKDFEARAHLAYALLALNLPEEAWPYFDATLDENPDFEYGELQLQAARCLLKLDYKSEAAEMYLDALGRRTHANAAVETADLLVELGRIDDARAVLTRTVRDAPHAPAFQRRRDAPHVRKALKRLKSLEKAPIGLK